MKKITSEDFNGLKFQPWGKERPQLIKEILRLNINEGVSISHREWPFKQNPSSYFVSNVDKFNGMFLRARKLADDEGYAIIRVS